MAWASIVLLPGFRERDVDIWLFDEIAGTSRLEMSVCVSVGKLGGAIEVRGMDVRWGWFFFSCMEIAEFGFSSLGELLWVLCV